MDGSSREMLAELDLSLDETALNGRQTGSYPTRSLVGNRLNWRKCMVRRRTARGLKLGEGTVRVNVSGLLVENRSPGT